jgi:hypothetical protein
MPALQHQPWPPVVETGGLSENFAGFVRKSRSERAGILAAARAQPNIHGEMIHRLLDVVSAYLFGYCDSPCFGRLDDDLEESLLSAKIQLERELLDHWLRVPTVSETSSQTDAAEHLRNLCGQNRSLSHELFDFIEHDASREALRVFLQTEAMRNEVVDDEVAMCLAGLQGPMKLALVSNLWDECGRGRLENFHTYWLRRLLEARGEWDDVKIYRSRYRPWFAQITTNVFNVFLSRPGLRLCGYGWFATNESWVAPHFEKVVRGLKRTGLYDDDVGIYFDAHINIDPVHTSELLGALEAQSPALSPQQTDSVVWGAHAALAATTAQYDRMFLYLKDLSRKKSE